MSAKCPACGNARDLSTPQHRFELSLRIGADDWTRLARLLQEIENELASRPPAPFYVISGGGYWLHVEENPEQTPEKYQADLDAWFAARRSEATR